MGFLKFSSNENHLLDFVKKGLIYINHVSFFTKSSESSMQFDAHELADEFVQPEGVTINIAGRDFNPVAPFSISNGVNRYTHIYCMLQIDLKPEEGAEKIFSERLWDDFGEFVVLVHDVQAFLDKFFAALKDAGINNAKSRYVEYFDENTYSGKVGPFLKRSIYEYQSEFRIAIESKKCDDEPLKLCLGNLSDVAEGPIHRTKSKNQYRGRSADI